MIDIKSMTLPEITEAFRQEEIPAFRAKQVFQWLHRGAESFSEMTDLSKDFREKLAKKYEIANADIEKKLVSEYDGTIKYLFCLNDGEAVESVLMRYKHGYSICISTQVGCKMGCKFCATGLGGFQRDLTACEMLAQIQKVQKDNNIRISNVVLMGMGEPLDNFDNVIRFLQLVSCSDGMNIGMRHISVSTCGLVDKIEKLIPMKPQFTLSVSLHAPNDRIRSQTMPVNHKWGIAELLTVCRSYAQATGRRISFEYAMISGVNDSDACAEELAYRLKGMLCHVNLIPVNSVQENSYKKSNIERQKSFLSILEKGGVTATVRRTLGADINASCGQLRRRRED